MGPKANGISGLLRETEETNRVKPLSDHFDTLHMYLKVPHLHEGLNLALFLQIFCGITLILAQIQKLSLQLEINCEILIPCSFLDRRVRKDGSAQPKGLGRGHLQPPSPQDGILFLNSAWHKFLFKAVCIFPPSPFLFF